MNSRRYGDLVQIAQRTDDRCHLCHLPVDLGTYGLTKWFGGVAASVDHLRPQSVGGTDHPENLRIAHQSCNSRRGVHDPTLARLLLSGRIEEPTSAHAWGRSTANAIVAAAATAGFVFAERDASSKPRFNVGAAVAGGLVAGGLMAILRAS